MLLVREIIMASTSNFRKGLLESAGVRFGAVPPRFREENVTGSSPDGVALGRATGKAVDVASRNPGSLVIGADQVLGFEGQVLGKVGSREEAGKRLAELSGKTHTLYSAFVLYRAEESGIEEAPLMLHEEVVEVPMTMRTLEKEDIEAYLGASYEWQGVVGCYQYENRGAQLFEKVGGDHTSIIGLPVLRLFAAMRALNVDTLRNPQGPWQLKLPGE